ncbi:DEAD/DEAH box helicase family protein [Duncaniella freteri]|uniref:DEAD/DEAH box helicase family protein n=1 Tax=Duncaniella freteri TaxID=2530391 RepID=UPI002590E05D|nr:DEAD/DEAH box helicase family protein [Duncaniella freteri]
MKVELRQFQQEALKKLRQHTNSSIAEYLQSRNPQIISFTAPTGAGKTIILSALLESIFMGDENHIERPNSIAIWLSDDPELNDQSKDKIEAYADRIPFGQCVTIKDPDFDQPVLEDGKIYFLNTQKLATSSNLTKHSDTRQNTIWETLRNTIEQKGDRLYFIIDEAHRGAKSPKEAGKATTIMQKFIFGDTEVGLPPMPIVLGMSATVNRFNQLVSGTTSTIRHHSVSADEVRRSGLLKDRITIAYPEEQVANKDMSVLQAAADEWIDKCNHWFQYSQEQHYSHVNPIMLVQVENGTGNNITNTDIADCITKIESRYGKNFKDGEIVHAFGSPKSAITFGQYSLPYIEPSRISESQNIKIVFFKDTLSTGWDCPRAEAMMSFRRANDSTYIAQLLGRMIRTPKQMRIQVDETLNEVKLFLPHFNQSTVAEVIKSLKEIEGGDLPTEVTGAGISNNSVQILSATSNASCLGQSNSHSVATSSPTRTTHLVPVSGVANSAYIPSSITNTHVPTGAVETQSSEISSTETGADSMLATAHATSNPNTSTTTSSAASDASTDTSSSQTLYSRSDILYFINHQGYKNYFVRKVKVNDYLKSLFKLARLITIKGIDLQVWNNKKEAAATHIKDYIDSLKAAGIYDSSVKKVMEFRMRQNVFDSFGDSVDNHISKSLFSTTDSDVDRQLTLSESQLGNEGISYTYGQLYGDPDDDMVFKLDVIIYAGQTANREALQEWAKGEFHRLKTTYRMKFVNVAPNIREEYERIVKDGDAVSEYPLNLPSTVELKKDDNGQIYTDHLYADTEGKAQFKLNTWEQPVLQAEQANPDFVCWMRNLDRKPWSLTIPYTSNNDEKPMYPDFLIVRRSGNDLVVDVLEPHNQSLEDNLAKAKGLARYAATEQKIGRIQLIRVTDGIGSTKHLHRLDLTDSLVRDKVLHCNSNEELSSIFAQYSFE